MPQNSPFSQSWVGRKKASNLKMLVAVCFWSTVPYGEEWSHRPMHTQVNTFGWNKVWGQWENIWYRVHYLFFLLCLWHSLTSATWIRKLGELEISQTFSLNKQPTSKTMRPKKLEGNTCRFHTHIFTII